MPGQIHHEKVANPPYYGGESTTRVGRTGISELVRADGRTQFAFGRYERLDRGLYLVPEIPGSPWREVVAAWLQAGADETVVSHQTALALHDLSEVIADSIHLTVPRSRRSRRHPPGAVVHTQLEPFSPSEVQTRHFVRVTAPARTIIDCLEAGVGLEQIAMAIDQAIERGWISRSDLRDKAAKRGRRVARLIDDLLRAQEDPT